MPGGRRVAWSAAGPRDGFPVVYLHGGIGTPIARAPQLDELIVRLQIRHVTIGRPGFTGSDPCAERRITDFPHDLERVADHLGLHRFAVIGVSSGGPYALASALALRDRIAATGIVSSLSPLGAPHASRAMPAPLRAGLRTVVRRPELVTRTAARLLSFLERHERGLARLAMLVSRPDDRGLLACARTGEGAVSSFLAAAGHGVRGMVDDYRLCCRPWGFDVGEVDCDVHLWHGAADEFVPLSHAQALALALPRCRMIVGTDDGHFFYRRRMADVLETLVTSARTPVTPAAHQLLAA
jgi:pimeloyl-ACP methyl ester carboxylesterase